MATIADDEWTAWESVMASTRAQEHVTRPPLLDLQSRVQVIAGRYALRRGVIAQRHYHDTGLMTYDVFFPPGLLVKDMPETELVSLPDEEDEEP